MVKTANMLTTSRNWALICRQPHPFASIHRTGRLQVGAAGSSGTTRWTHAWYCSPSFLITAWYSLSSELI